MRPEVKSAGRDVLRQGAELCLIAFVGGVVAVAFLTPVTAAAFFVRWLW